MFLQRYLNHGIISMMLLICLSSNTFAGVMINKTRIIYNADDKSASTTLSNVTADNYAVQVWVNGTSDRSDEQVPFIATPALTRIGPGEDQIVKIIHVPDTTLYADRESVFYFNAQEIPALKKDTSQNQLTLAIRTRIKLFYRPAGLAGSPDDAVKKIAWQRIDRDGKSWLRASNNTPWNISFSTISFQSGARQLEVSNPEMLPPFSHLDYLLPGSSATLQGSVRFSAINDYGGIKQQPDILIH